MVVEGKRIESVPYHSSLAIANEFLERARRDHRELTHMHLQKLVYLAHGWAMVVTGRPLIDDEFEAWEFGPVNRRLYDALKLYGPDPIQRLIHWGEDTPFRSDDGGKARADLEYDEKRVVDRVWEVYGQYKAFQLSALTHAKDSPWEKIYVPKGKNRRIENDLIADYFADLAARD